ncbi:hypothetical protein [Planctomicrobium piriforme]|nr:hypothetical protein [Planctomicrobium piriforme]
MPRTFARQTACLAVLVGTCSTAWATPPNASGPQSPVLLSQQIELLEDEPHPAGDRVTASKAAKAPAADMPSRGFFPSARSLFGFESSGTVQPAEGKESGQSRSKGILRISMPELWPTPAASGELPPPELIPPPPSIEVVESNPDCIGLESEIEEVQPRSQKKWRPIRFPGLGKLFGN